MKQVLVRSGSVVVEEVPAPLAEPGTVLVAVDHSAVSVGTELSGVRSSGTPLWKRALSQPENVKRVVEMVRTEGLSKTRDVVGGKLSSAAQTGYSAAGVVLELGEGVNDLAVGQRVACAGAGLANHAEVVAVPRNLVVPVPDGVSFRDAATVTLGAIAMQGVRRAAPSLGETFVVIGLGILGQLTVQLLKADGCRVFGSDLDARRVDRARELGMDGVLDPADPDTLGAVLRQTDGHGADGVIITAAAPGDEIVSTAFSLCRWKGRVVLVGDVGLGLKRADLYEKELDFLISTSYGPGRYDPRYEDEGLDYPIGYVRWTENRNMAEYLRLVLDCRIVVEPLIDAVYRVEDAPTAYAALQAGEESPLLALLSYDRPTEERLVRVVSAPSVASVRDGVVRIAVVGAGGFAKSTHLPNLAALSDRYHVRAIVTRTGSNAADVATHYGADYSTTDYGEVLKDPDVDAVLIATRHDLHARAALDALAAGKHVLVEKPLVMDRSELDEVIGFFEGRESAPVLLTGFNRRFSPHACRVRELVRERTAPMMIAYRMNAGFIPLDHWVHSREQGGGRNIGEACHIYDLFTYLTGARLTGVTARAIAPTTSQYAPHDNFAVTATFADGSVATLLYTALGAREHPKEQMEVFCDGAVHVLDDYRSLEVRGSREPGVTTQPQDKGHKRELIEFADAIAGGEVPIPLWQQVQAMEIAFSVEDELAWR